MSATGIIDHVVRPHVAMTEDKYLRAPSSGVQAFLPSNMPSDVGNIVNAILRLFAARDMNEHCMPMPLLARDVVWDAPPFLLSRKGSVRVSSYFFKFFARQRFVPSHIEVRGVGMGANLLEVSGTLELHPRRTLLVPASLLLPQTVPIRSTLLIGVNGPLSTGEIELVVAKWHNLPALPNFVRAFNGLVFGTVPHLFEPIWSYLPEFIGDDFYRRRREASFSVRHPNSQMPLVDAAKDVVSDTAQGVMDYGVSSVHNIRDGVGYLWTNFMEAAGFTVGRARAYTGAAADVATRVAGTAYDTATAVAGTAYNTAANVAGTAANVAGNVAGKAYDTASTAAGTAAGAAQMTYDTAADAANKTYATAAGAANQAYETGTAAAGAAYDTGRQGVEAGRQTVASGMDRATIKAQQAAEDARRGYETGKARPVEVPTALAPAGVTTTRI